MNARRAVPLAALCAVLVVPLATAAAASVSPFCGGAPLPARDLVSSLPDCPSTDYVEGVIAGSNIPFLPQPSAVDDVLDTVRSHTSDARSASNATWDEGTTLNALALSHASGVALGPEDVAGHAASSGLDMTWANFLIPRSEVILNILSLGVGPVPTTGFDVSYGGNYAGAAATQTTRRITDANANSGLALLGGGIALDPHLLIDSTEAASDRARVGTFPAPSRPPEGADLASQAAIAPIDADPVPGVFAFSNRSVEHRDEVIRSRVVELPERVAFAGLALHRNGIDFDAADAVSFSQMDRMGEAAHYDYNRERAVLLYWLTLGLRFAPS